MAAASTRRRRLRHVEETSAGGLVLNSIGPNAQAAIIGRLDRRGRMLWSLPKGHLESGESPEQAAVREVEEETGIRGEIVGPLGTIAFWFIADSRRIHKTVHHFLLLARAGDLCADDVEVSDVAWVSLTDLSARLAYEDERQLVQKVPDLLADIA